MDCKRSRLNDSMTLSVYTGFVDSSIISEEIFSISMTSEESFSLGLLDEGFSLVSLDGGFSLVLTLLVGF